LNRIFKPFVFVLAAIYFVVDAAFWTITRPVTRLLGDHWIFERARTWIMSLRPYPTLALFIVPVLVLEPAKPVAAYLTATGHLGSGLMVLGIAELLKLILIERLFKVSREKLMSIPAFAWCYGKICQARNWVESLSAWQLMRRLGLSAQHAIRRYVLEIRTSRKRQRLSLQSR
jgi:AraC-like DNA-binding protein